MSDPAEAPDTPGPSRSLTLFTLFTTSGTLICCALPILLVTFGLGTAVVAMTSAFPFLITLTQYKIWIFAFSGLMLLVSGYFLYRPGSSCPADPLLAVACQRASRWNRRIFVASAIIWVIGFAAAYLLLPLRIWLGW
jgi:hypothetical protein